MTHPIPQNSPSEASSELKQRLQLLRNENGNHVIATVPDLYALIDFIQAHTARLLLEARLDQLDNIPGRRAGENKYIVDIADIDNLRAALKSQLKDMK